MGFSFGSLFSDVGDVVAAPFTDGASLAGLSNPFSSAVTGADSDNSLLGSVISGGASLLGGLNQQASAQATVSQQEAFQEQERLTAYPDTVKSLEAAGLNPVLAATQGPLGTPAGAMYNPQNILGGAVTSAMQGYQAQAQLQNTLNQAALAKSQEGVGYAQSQKTQAEADVATGAWSSNLQTQLATNSAQAAQAKADAAEANFKYNLYTNHPDLLMSGQYFQNLIGPLSNSAGSLMHGTGALIPSPGTTIDRSTHYYP